MSTKYTKTQLREMRAEQIADLALVEFGIEHDSERTKMATIDLMLEAQDAQPEAPEAPESTQGDDSDDSNINTSEDDDDSVQDDDDSVQVDPEVPEGCILVKAVGPSNRVVIWERDEAHPGGEIWVRGGDARYVGLTNRVDRLLGKALIKVEKGDAG